MALMGGGLGTASAGAASNGGLLASLLGNAGGGAPSGGGSALQLNLASVTGGNGGSADASGFQMPNPFTEHNMPSRPGYQMVGLNAI
mmetsp:Transcript_13179/g.17916  ORF Transcript_13179/g.17916 Transcript_13179/m.17916 type:complete len:87 (+) Transcript_13179:345-605(+)